MFDAWEEHEGGDEVAEDVPEVDVEEDGRYESVNLFVVQQQEGLVVAAEVDEREHVDLEQVVWGFVQATHFFPDEHADVSEDDQKR